MWCTFIIARIALWVHFGVISPKLHIYHSNPSNHFIMCRVSFWCNNLIMHTYCAFHIYHVLIAIFSLSGVLFPPIERDSEVKIDNSSWRILVLNRQVKSLFLKQYSGFLKPGKHKLLSAHLWFKVIWSSYDAYDSKVSWVSSICSYTYCITSISCSQYLAKPDSLFVFC